MYRAELRGQSGLHHQKKTLLSLALAAILIGGAVSFFLISDNTNPIPKDIRKNSQVALYYPSSLPKGWKLDKTTFEQTQGVVLYTLKSSKGTIVISEQQQQDGFNYDQFYQKSLTSSSSVSTPLGSGAIGKLRGKAVGSITIDKSWILASSSTGSVDKSDIQYIFYHLKK
jgi:hypothetical protein